MKRLILLALDDLMASFEEWSVLECETGTWKLSSGRGSPWAYIRWKGARGQQLSSLPGSWQTGKPEYRACPERGT